jgi:hypothetical protein
MQARRDATGLAMLLAEDARENKAGEGGDPLPLPL